MRQLALINLVIVAALAVAVSGCGYRPLYGQTGAGASVTAALSDVAVAEQNDRAGQIIRNELISGLGSTGSRYILKFEIVEKTQSVSSISKNVVDRHRYRLNLNYQLLEAGSGREVTSGKSFSNVTYDTVQEPVADLQAAETARERAARELAQDLKIRLSAFFATRFS